MHVSDTRVACVPPETVRHLPQARLLDTTTPPHAGCWLYRVKFIFMETAEQYRGLDIRTYTCTSV